jgi:hypothetical protein
LSYEDEDAERSPLLLLPDDAEPLLSSLHSTIEESLGMAMIFSVYSALKESAEDLVRSRQVELRTKRDQKIAAEEAKENAKFQGEAVTRDSFTAWREKFREEMRLADEEKKKAEEIEKGKKGIKEEGKLTGRELWEKGLVGKYDEDLEGDEAVDGVSKDVEGLTVSA